MLNLYCAILVKNDHLSEDIALKVNKYVESKKNIYGYSGIATNYDLEASVYYTNIVNMMESGEESGIR